MRGGGNTISNGSVRDREPILDELLEKNEAQDDIVYEPAKAGELPALVQLVDDNHNGIKESGEQDGIFTKEEYERAVDSGIWSRYAPVDFANYGVFRSMVGSFGNLTEPRSPSGGAVDPLKEYARAEKYMSQANKKVYTSDMLGALTLLGRAKNIYNKLGAKWELRHAEDLIRYKGEPKVYREKMQQEARNMVDDRMAKAVRDEEMWEKVRIKTADIMANVFGDENAREKVQTMVADLRAKAIIEPEAYERIKGTMEMVRNGEGYNKSESLARYYLAGDLVRLASDAEDYEKAMEHLVLAWSTYNKGDTGDLSHCRNRMVAEAEEELERRAEPFEMVRLAYAKRQGLALELPRYVQRQKAEEIKLEAEEKALVAANTPNVEGLPFGHKVEPPQPSASDGFLSSVWEYVTYAWKDAEQPSVVGSLDD